MSRKIIIGHESGNEKKNKFYIRTSSSIEQKGVLITVFINNFFSLSQVDVTKIVEVYSKNNFCFRD